MELTIESVTKTINEAVSNAIILKEKDSWTKRDIAAWYNVSTKTVDRMIKSPKFPKYTYLKGTKIKQWRQLEVRRFLG